jgi:hypothetical protein
MTPFSAFVSYFDYLFRNPDHVKNLTLAIQMHCVKCNIHISTDDVLAPLGLGGCFTCRNDKPENMKNSCIGNAQVFNVSFSQATVVESGIGIGIVEQQGNGLVHI